MSLRFRQIHLDFHNSEKIPSIAECFDAQEFAATMKQAGVDSVTVFSKCHHGMIYHPTRFSEAIHPGLQQRNLLGDQITALHAQGIRAPIYISVGYDERYAKLHSDCMEVGPNGKWLSAGPLEAGWHKLCLNSDYINYVFAQTQEVLETFPVDGLFFDIISQRGCCCQSCLQGMQALGLNPENPTDRAQWDRIVLDRYCMRQTELVRQVNKDCTLFYNAGHVGPWIRPALSAYTHLELESLPTGGWGYDHFPLTVRYARNLGLDYIGMTGKFQKSWADFGGFKPQPALEYDCFISLAHGGGCSIGDQLHPSGQLDPATYRRIAPVYHSVAAKEPWCADAKSIAEIAVVNPEAIGAVEGRVDAAARGALRLLQEAHYQFDVVDFAMPWDKYRLVILPDKIILDPAQAELVRNYLKSGGSLICSFRSGLAKDGTDFALPELGLSYVGDLPFHPDYLAPHGLLASGVDDTQHVMYERGAQVRAVADSEVLADVWEPYFNRTWEHYTSHKHTPACKKSADPGAVRNGACIYFAHPVFATYSKHGPEALRLMLRNAVTNLLPEPALVTDAPSTAHISVMRQSGRTIAHVLHYIPERRYSELDLIVERLPLYNVRLQLRLGEAPRRVYLAPEDVQLKFTYNAGMADVVVPKVDGHVMVVFE